MTQIDRINGLIGSIAVKAPCKAATTANITLSGAQTIDGVSLTSGDRCLVKNQTTASENGIYDVSSTAWSRAIDFNGRRDIVQGTAVRIISGTVSAQYFYEVTTSDPIIGNTDLAFALVNFPVTTTPFMATLLDDETAAEALTTLGTSAVFRGTAAGTADVITVSASPALSELTDGTVLFITALLANTTTTPTLNVDSLGAKTITKNGNQALLAGDIARVDHEIILRYDAGNAVWELLNPAVFAEGIWTPTLQDSSFSDSEGQIYFDQAGQYTKIGNRVFITGYFNITSLGTLSTGAGAYIGGLPFAAAATDAGSSVSFGFASSLAVSAGQSLSGWIFEADSFITLRLWDDTAGTTEALISEISANASLRFQGQYTTDA